MSSAGAAARRALLGWIGRAVTGRGIGAHERDAVDRDLALLGFRKAARGLLLRRMAAAALRDGGMTVLAPCMGGRFVLACAGDDLGVGWEILEHGTYEPHLARFYERTLRPGMTVLDVGANIGFHALHAARLVGPSGRVFAVEPDPGNAALLRMSVARNDGISVEVIEAALSDLEQELVLTDLGNAANSGARFTHPDRASLEALVHGPSPLFRSVPAHRWDDLHPEVPIDLVKLDVEGFEPRVVRGMEQSLARFRPTVVSEFAPSNLETLGGVEPAAYLAWFRERGYAAHVVLEPGGETVPADDASLRRALARRHHADLAFSPA